MELVNPEVEPADGPTPGIVPVYPDLGPLKGRRMRSVMARAAEAARALEDPLPGDERERLRLPSLGEALLRVHHPDLGLDAAADDLDERLQNLVGAAVRRLAFDELLAVCCATSRRRAARRGCEAPQCTGALSARERAARVLPFRLTGAQVRVVDEIMGDLARSVPMARLLQGDVGSGKTAVAALALLAAADTGVQVALMAPTELLAEQHEASLREVVRRGGHELALLTGSQPAPVRRRVGDGLRDGSLRCVVGTHALLAEAVTFSDLGLVVIDEQHRFGVSQRATLVAKGRRPHLLVMTATPIPRSLALTVYGDLDLSVIDELPPGRTPVRTVVREASHRPRLERFLRDEISGGGRAFVVCPTIGGGEDSSLVAVEERARQLAGSLPKARIGIMHGQMKRDQREKVSEAFRRGAIDVLVSTTVVEVGVDVPEASVILIEDADRFGLSQLHQLRGRVGRGRRRSYCVLMISGDTLSPEARTRLEVLCTTNDGFRIAEADLELRGPGELGGTRQWGVGGLRFADLVRSPDLAELAHDTAERLAISGRLGNVARRLERYWTATPQPSG